VLARAVSAPPDRRGRRVVGVLAAGLLGAGAIGGVAYATDGVPALFTGIVDDFARDAGIPASQAPELTQIADLTLPDGSRFAAWRGANDAMWCTTYVDDWDGVHPDGWGGGGCGTGTSDADLNSASVAWARSRDRSTYYPVLFGVAGDAVSVRVTGTFAGTGEPTGLTLPVDPATSAYAVALPGTNAHPWAYLDDGSATFRRDSGITLRLLDADGHVLRTVEGPPA
jgi:hypothetical protein